MSKYSFDVTDERRILNRCERDPPDPFAACTEARAMAGSLSKLQHGRGRWVAGGRVVVIDSDGIELLALSLPAG